MVTTPLNESLSPAAQKVLQLLLLLMLLSSSRVNRKFIWYLFYVERVRCSIISHSLLLTCSSPLTSSLTVHSIIILQYVL